MKTGTKVMVAGAAAVAAYFGWKAYGTVQAASGLDGSIIGASGFKVSNGILTGTVSFNFRNKSNTDLTVQSLYLIFEAGGLVIANVPPTTQPFTVYSYATRPSGTIVNIPVSVNLTNLTQLIPKALTIKAITISGAAKVANLPDIQFAGYDYPMDISKYLADFKASVQAGITKVNRYLDAKFEKDFIDFTAAQKTAGYEIKATYLHDALIDAIYCIYGKSSDTKIYHYKKLALLVKNKWEPVTAKEWAALTPKVKLIKDFTKSLNGLGKISNVIGIARNSKGNIIDEWEGTKEKDGINWAKKVFKNSDVWSVDIDKNVYSLVK